MIGNRVYEVAFIADADGLPPGVYPSIGECRSLINPLRLLTTGPISKTELNWLDRMLMMAVSRQKRELREVDDFATSMEDRVTSHWWKGIIAVNRTTGYDNAQPPKSTKGKTGSYSQQLEARIQASRQQGIVLALPCLKEQLQLSQFEKNVILMALAPEINQRFGRIYSYLQYQHDESDWDLPTVNLWPAPALPQ